MIDLIFDLDMDLPEAPAPAAPAPKMASDKQLAFIRKLLAEKDLTNTAFPAWSENVLSGLNMGEASRGIEQLMALPRKAREAKAEAPEGIHYLDGVVYKVQRSLSSGRVYAKILEGTSWSYSAGTAFKLSADTLMTREDAAAYGKLYGVCCACGRTLTDEGSIEAGIGPICSRKGWS